MADPVAGVVEISIRGVFAPGLVDFFEIVLEFAVADRQEGPDDFGGSFVGFVGVFLFQSDNRINSAKAVGAGSAKNAHKDSFGLVVERVASGDGVETGRADVVFFLKLSKERIPHLASGCFDAQMIGFGFDGHIAAGRMKFEFVGAGELGDEFFVLVGFGAAEFVVEVNDGQDDAEFVAEFKEQAQEADGVGAPRDSDANAIAGI